MADAIICMSLTVPEEESLGTASTTRNMEFAAGRTMARLALKQAGVEVPHIPRRPSGSPRWPSGLTGSITHAAGIFAAIVAPVTACRSIGLDVEAQNSVTKDLDISLFSAVELRNIERCLFNAPSVDWRTVWFCAKEASFKALGPFIEDLDISFEQIRIRTCGPVMDWDSVAGCHLASSAAGFSLKGRVVQQSYKIWCSMWLSP